MDALHVVSRNMRSQPLNFVSCEMFDGTICGADAADLVLGCSASRRQR